MNGPEQNEGYYPVSYPPKKKWLAAMLAAFFPGTGHMYLGLMSRGILIMLMLALNIVGIVYFGIENEYDNKVLLIVLLSLMVPIQYFYNLFSVLQCAELVNDRRAAGLRPPADPLGASGTGPSQDGAGRWDGEIRQVPVGGIIVLLFAALFLFVLSRSDWGHRVPHLFGSLPGAVLLIGIGVLVWLWDRRGQSQKKE
ncbi:hypothetical protein [Cohnella fermenti]|uniref:Uncharacterized protein n=1 Tax=Cohnella fermenti TaxID=2565925 RepID=A0A4S4BL45_9BACL|nr:hypothetical protein [Cohnella fermenti]THF72977.1 hypothetical protein E6C55_31000 [Cohnella fermenti]